jgi:hypothetical protein
LTWPEKESAPWSCFYCHVLYLGISTPRM